MTDQKPIPRDPHSDDLDALAEEPTPGQQSSSGGGMATDIASRDEARTPLGGDPEPTRVTKKDQPQPFSKTQGGTIGS